jgi:hypothetical protein
MNVVVFSIVLLVISFFIWLNIKFYKWLIKYDISVVNDKLNLARYWLIDGHIMLNLKDIESIEFDIRLGIPFNAIISEKEIVRIPIDQKQFEALKLVASQHHIKCITTENKRSARRSVSLRR